MIRKLRRRLILASMLAVFIVLATVIGLFHYVNYQRIVSDADSLLTLLSWNSGHFPKPSQDENGQAESNHPLRETRRELQFFSAVLAEDGSISLYNVEKVPSIDEETAALYAQQCADSEKNRDFYKDYRYILYEEDGSRRIIFLDCERNLSAFRFVLLTSICLSAAGLLAVLLLVLLLSRRIVRPISASYEKQKRFITDAGHEMKTPVTIIHADTELLEMEYGQNEWLDDIRSQTRRLAALTNDLIFLARMEETEKLQMIEFPISDLVAENASSFQSLAITQNKHFSMDIQPMLTYCGNEKSISQLVNLLLDNAVKYSSAEGDIHLTLSAQEKQLVMTVENTADGISEETLHNMFDRFYRADPSRNSTVMGYGIGLSTALAIVNAHRGKIDASAENGRFRITVTLPMNQG